MTDYSVNYMKGGNSQAYAILAILILILSLVVGIWGFIGKKNNLIRMILSIVLMVLAVVLWICCRGQNWLPQATNKVNWTYQTGIAAHLLLGFSVVACICAILSFVIKPRKIRAAQEIIPEVAEIKQEQIEAKYNVIVEEQNSEAAENEMAIRNSLLNYHAGAPRGVIVGITGIYAGAEIPMRDGETITMGRTASNALVFEGQTSVSRKHCQITWNAQRGVFVFRDYSSSGSFIYGTDECLPQNLDIDMIPGTVIELGNAANAFRLE